MNTYKNTTQNVQPGIYLETKPVVDTFKSSSKRILPKFFENSHHAYLRYVRSDGKELIIRGGPKNNQQINGIGLGKIYMQTNKPFKQSYDYYSPGTESYKRFSHKLDIDEKKLDEIWNEISKVSNKINQGQYPYDNIPQQQNSNSVIRTILDETKFDVIKQMPDFMLKHLPGYDKNLFSLPAIEIDKKEATELKRAWGKIMHDNEEKEQKPVQSEEKTRKSYYERYKEHENPLQDLLYKKPEELTKEEVEQAHKHSFETRSGK